VPSRESSSSGLPRHSMPLSGASYRRSSTSGSHQNATLSRTFAGHRLGTSTSYAMERRCLLRRTANWRCDIFVTKCSHGLCGSIQYVSTRTQSQPIKVYRYPGWVTYTSSLIASTYGWESLALILLGSSERSGALVVCSTVPDFSIIVCC
jgi:hypothetical protein